MGSAPCGHACSSCRAGGCRCEQPPLSRPGPQWAADPALTAPWQAALHHAEVSTRPIFLSLSIWADSVSLGNGSVTSLEKTLERRGRKRRVSETEVGLGREGKQSFQSPGSCPPVSHVHGGWDLPLISQVPWPAGSLGPCWALFRPE